MIRLDMKIYNMMLTDEVKVKSKVKSRLTAFKHQLKQDGK